jgi:hypothetical protein
MAENESLNLYHEWHERKDGGPEDAMSYNLQVLGYGTDVKVTLTSTRTAATEAKQGTSDGVAATDVAHDSAKDSASEVQKQVERYEIAGRQLAELIKTHGTKVSAPK